MTDATLCACNPQLPLRIEVYDWDRFSDPDLIGVATTSLQGLMDLACVSRSLSPVLQCLFLNLNLAMFYFVSRYFLTSGRRVGRWS